MAKLLKLRRGSTSQHGSFTGAEGEVTVDTDKETLVIHDGSTAGGHPVAAEDMANVSSTNIVSRISNSALAGAKVQPNFGSQNVETTGTLASGALTVTGNIAVSGTVDGVDLQTLNTAVSANTAKVTNATHTGDVTGATSLTIANGAVTSAKIANGTIAADKLAVNAVTTANITDANVTTAKLENNAINGNKLADLAVSTTKIQDDAVTYAKIQNVSATDRILGRDSSGAGVIEEITPANLRTMINVEDGATADQTAAEILALISDQHIRTTAQIGRDSNDHFQFTDAGPLDLYINGNNEFRFEADGDFHADGDVIAYSTTTASDENLKKDITTVTDAVAKVEALKGVTFTWKKNENTSAGVIAQDVEKVLPQVVKTVSNPAGEEYKAVNYGGLTSILIEAIKDLSARVKVLEAK